MNVLIRRLQQQHPTFPTTTLMTGVRQFERLTVQPGTCLLRRGQTCERLYFIEKGVVQCYYQKEGQRKQCVALEWEGAFVTEPYSFFAQAPSQYQLVALETCILWYLSKKQLQLLYQTHHAWAVWGTAFLEAEYAKLYDLYHLFTQGTASERYHNLLLAYPTLVQRVSLGVVADLLGISQGSLSRIRAMK